jgi:hypothetical protein
LEHVGAVGRISGDDLMKVPMIIDADTNRTDTRRSRRRNEDRQRRLDGVVDCFDEDGHVGTRGLPGRNDTEQRSRSVSRHGGESASEAISHAGDVGGRCGLAASMPRATANVAAVRRIRFSTTSDVPDARRASADRTESSRRRSATPG